MDDGRKGVFPRTSNLYLMFWTAFILGFAGSFHCMGMCSPLAMAVTNLSTKIFLSRFIYNTGRIVTYGIFGSIVASAGLMFPMIKYQNLLSIILGFALLMIGLAGVSIIRIPFLTSALGNFSLLLKRLFSKWLQKKSHLSTFAVGSLNGVLPCGLSFLALTYCVTLSGPVDGFMFMLAFGAGTLPVMLGFTGAFSWIVSRLNLRAKSMTTGMLILSGLLLVGRVFFIHLPHAASVPQGVVDIVLCK
jgi:sulfite exporter TauE/SafE